MTVEKLSQNVDTLASLRTRAEQGVSRHQRWIERFTSEIGRPGSVYLIALFVTAWTTVNSLGERLGLEPFDPPPFAWLQGIVGLSALVMTTTVLITQQRQSRQAEQRAQLELQVNLVAEQKIAKLIDLVEELRRDIPIVRDRVDEVAEVMKEPVNPHAVLAALEETREASPRDAEPDGAPRQTASSSPRR